MKDEFVMVPRVWAERVISAGRGEPVCQSDVELLSAAVKAEQHQGEPVELPARKKTTSGLLSDSNTHNRGWNACLDEIDKLGPLYTHAEVEPTPECFCVEHGLHIEDLKAQLAEAHTLLREVSSFLTECAGRETMAFGAAQGLALSLHAALSASAEPVAPVDRDERADFEAWLVKKIEDAGHAVSIHFVLEWRDKNGNYEGLPYIQSKWEGWQARAALERKP